jgi:hypothetical protein
MRSEPVRPSSSPPRPPLASYDPLEPAPQAAAWRRALKVVGRVPPARQVRIAKTTVRRVEWG